MSEFYSPVVANQDAPSRYLPATQMAAMVMNETGVSEMPKVGDRDDLYVQWLFDCNLQMGVLAGSDEPQVHEAVVEGLKARLPKNYFAIHDVRVKGESALPIWVGIARFLCSPKFRNGGRPSQGAFILNSAGPFHVSTSQNLEGRTLVFSYYGPLVDEHGIPYCDYLYKDAYIAFCEWRLSMYTRGAIDTQRALKRRFMLAAAQCAAQGFRAEVSKDQWDFIVSNLKNPYYFGSNPYTAAASQANWGPHIRFPFGRWGSGWPLGT